AVGGLALLASGGSDYWLLAWPSCSQSPSKVCERAFLFPFPVYESPVPPLVDTSDFPPQPSERDSVIGLSLMAVVLMFLTWFQALGVLEQYASKRRATFCPAFHLSVELGPSFLLAPVAVFFTLWG
ncbi:hypothetical protein CRUP_031443, partial [Coryphaenoides rupestris]